MYFKPQKDITNEELALVNGFFAMALADNLNNIFEALKSGKNNYQSTLKKDNSKMMGIGSLVISDYLVDIMPANVKRHFSTF